jgi:uncharacterized protein (DUF433 family)
MNRQERIVADPKVLAGKPVVKGTRIAVEFIFDLLANGWPESEILQNYPRLTHDDIQACLSYATALIKSRRSIPSRLCRKAFDAIVGG